MLILTFTVPLAVYTTKGQTKKSKAILNLNNYRNWHFYKSNTVKHIFTELIRSYRLLPLGHGPYKIEYIVMQGGNRKYDVANVCSIVDKFVCDALVTCNVIQDDHSEIITELVYKAGSRVSSDMGFCEVNIYTV